MRCFIAVEIPSSLKRKIERMLEGEKKKHPHLKWVSEENLHITLKFLGEVEKERLEKVKRAIEKVARGFKSFDVSISEIGSFPQSGNIRVLFFSVDRGSEELKNIAMSLEKELEKLGFKREGRDFIPHMTVARWKRGTPQVKRSSIDIKNLETEPFKVRSLTLFESILRSEGPIYKKIADFRLKNE